MKTTHHKDSPRRKHPAKAAIFGGSFDPPHVGHLDIMKKALEQLDIDRLIVVPAYISPFKKEHAAPPKKRLEWLRKMTAFDPRIEVSDYEIRKGGPSYTIETVEHFAPFFDTIYLIIGADNLKGLPKWHRFDDLNRRVTWVVATRDETPVPEGFIRLDVHKPVSSTALRRQIDPGRIPEAIREDVTAYYQTEHEGE